MVFVVALDQRPRRDHLADEQPLAAADSRQSVRNGAFVMPAMGASTTGGCTVCGPICEGGGGAWSSAPLSRIHREVR